MIIPHLLIIPHFADLINFISKNLTRRFKIDHSYMPYEFCVKIFKEQEILRPENVFKT